MVHNNGERMKYNVKIYLTALLLTLVVVLGTAGCISKVMVTPTLINQVISK